MYNKGEFHVFIVSLLFIKRGGIFLIFTAPPPSPRCNPIYIKIHVHKINIFSQIFLKLINIIMVKIIVIHLH